MHETSPPGPGSTLSFVVYGEPIPQGSIRGYVIPAKGARKARANIVPDNARTKPLRQDVRDALRTGYGLRPPYLGAIVLDLTFYFERPKGHYGVKGLLPSAPREKLTKPDTDKLARSVLDALTGLLFRDDAQVVELHATKAFAVDGFGPSCRVEVAFR